VPKNQIPMLNQSQLDPGGDDSPAYLREEKAFTINASFSVVLAATNVPQSVPGMLVPAGSTVRLRANNGTTAGNAKVIFAASYREALANGGGTPLAPLDMIVFPAHNLARIWIAGTAGDGVVVTVTG